MMNPFATHPREQGVTYVEHWCFAMGIAYRLLSSVVAFAVHAILPFIPIEPRLDLGPTRNRISLSITNRARFEDFLRSNNERRDAYEPEDLN
jgi:hypothetical protein